MGCASSAGVSDTHRRSTPGKLHELDLFLDEFQLGEMLVEGSFGQVFVARPIRLGRSDNGREGRECLVKVSENHRSLVLTKEVSIQKQVGAHTNVVQMLGHFRTDSRCYLVLENCRCSLLGLLETEPPANELEMARLWRQMLLAVAHVHGCGVVHRDIQPRSFLLGGPSGRDLQLTDFGLATRLATKVSRNMGALEYAAPEVLRGDVFLFKSDVWAFGVTAYLMLYGDHPYRRARSEVPLELAIKTGLPSPIYSVARVHSLLCARRSLGWSPSVVAADFVRAVLAHDSMARKSAAACLALPLLALPKLAVDAASPEGQKPADARPWGLTSLTVGSGGKPEVPERAATAPSGENPGDRAIGVDFPLFLKDRRAHGTEADWKRTAETRMARRAARNELSASL